MEIQKLIEYSCHYRQAVQAIILTSILALFLSAGLRAQEVMTCLEKAAKLGPHQKVTLVGRFWSPLGTRLIEGKISSIDVQNSTITMRDMVDNFYRDSVFNSAHLEAIRYRSLGNLRPDVIGGCALVGALMGVIIGSSLANMDFGFGPSDDHNHATAQGLTIGAAMGLGVGLIASLVTSSERTIKCE